MVIDTGLHPVYYQDLEADDRLLRESCYSMPGSPFKTEREQIIGLNGTLYKYKWVSLCRNNRSEQHGSLASMVRTDGIRVLRNAGNRNRDLEVRHLHHQSTVADVITSNTAQSVKQWHTHIMRLLGQFDPNTEKFLYTHADFLQKSAGSEPLSRALKDVAFGSLGLNGVEVINFSGGRTGEVYPTPCDNHPEITRDDKSVEIMGYINRLYNRGVMTVAASANHTGINERDNYKMPFPACLSRTISVSGYRESNGSVLGAVSPHTDFVHDMDHQNPINFQPESGTSYAAPKVSAHIAQLREITTVRNVFGVLNALRQTANIHCRERGYNNNQIRVQFCVPQPNYQQARNLVIDSFWSDLFRLNVDGAVRDDRVGWNYGSSSHRNGVRIEMTTLPPLQQLKAQAQSSGSLQIVTLASSTIGEVLRFSLNAYDIDTSDEVLIQVNGIDYRNLDTTGSNRTGGKQTFCIPRTDLNATGATNQITLRVKSPGETWGVTNLKAERSFNTSGCKFALPTFPDLPPNDDRLAGTSQPFGNAYERDQVSEVPFSFTLSNNLPTPSTYNANSVQRDLRLKFTTKSGDAFATRNGTFVRVNGTQILATELFHSDEERSYEVIVNRNRLRNGRNTISFRPINTTNAIWGIRGISIEYINPINLTVGANNTSVYGYSQTPSRYTGMRANFSVSPVQNDYLLSVQGWDIDRSDETQVFINGVSLGHLATSSNDTYNFGSTFVLPRSVLKSGRNQIEFVQRRPSGGWNGASDEKWAVRNLQVSVLRPDLTASRPRILDPKIEPNFPFNVSTVISNSGEGSSIGTTLRYYVSSNKTITTSDTVLKSQSVGALNPGASVTLSNTLQSSLVDQGYFIGVCVVSVPNEVSSGNNCSAGIPLRKQLGYLPAIFMLMLGDGATQEP